MKKGIILILISLGIAGSLYFTDKILTVFTAIDGLREAGNYGKAAKNIDNFKNSFTGKIVLFIPSLRNKIAYEEALIAVFRGEPWKAKEMFSELRSVAGDKTLLSDVNFALGNLAFFLDDDIPEAKEFYIKALEINPENNNARINLELLLHQKEMEINAGERMAETEKKENNGKNDQVKENNGGQTEKESKSNKQKMGGKPPGRSKLQSKEIWGGGQIPPMPEGPRY